MAASEQIKNLDTFSNKGKYIGSSLPYDYISGKSFLDAAHFRSNKFFLEISGSLLRN